MVLHGVIELIWLGSKNLS